MITLHFHELVLHIEHLTHLSYSGIFVIVIASGHLVPLPESVILIILGYLSALRHVALWKVLLAAMSAAVVGDVIFYFLAFGGGELARRFTDKLDVSLIRRYEAAEEKNLFFLILFSHFVPGWRLANPLICGVTEMPWKKFTLYTIISVLIYVPILVGLGFFFSADILSIVAVVESIRQALFWLVFVGVVAALVILYNRSHAKK